MHPPLPKPDEPPPAYDDIMLNRGGAASDGHLHHMHHSSGAPWWDARYWSKKVWLAFGVVVIAVVAVGVGVGVSVSQRNAYPNYTALSYSLVDTCTSALFPTVVSTC